MKTMFGFAAAADAGLPHVARARRERAAILMRGLLPVSELWPHLPKDARCEAGVASLARFLFLRARRRKCDRRRVVKADLLVMRPRMVALRAET
jgi:hypothetical protein